MRLRNILILGLFVLAACASLSKQQCLDGNWYQIGVNDGVAGYLPDRLSAHIKACSEVSVDPDAKTWEKGRREGLKTYCSPESAYQVGRKGRQISNVCTASKRAEMAPAFSHGQAYYDIGQKITGLENEIATAREEIAVELAANGGAVNVQVMFLQGEIFRLNSRIQRLEEQRQKFATWP